MAKISRDILRKLIDESFFSQLKDLDAIIGRLDEKGFSISAAKSGLVAQLLAKLCQEGLLERKKDEQGEWRYRKISNE